MSELLPCPFCGGEVEMLTAESMNGGYLFGIMCNDCRSRGDVYDTEAEAIAAWNTRAERTMENERKATCHYEQTGGTFGFLVCDSCGGVIIKDYRFNHRSMKPTPFCRWCGARITKRVAKVVE